MSLHKDDDPAFELASKRARASFRYFWRELYWEYRRIVPALGLAAFKVALTDDVGTAAEVMWVNEVNFDGYHISGRLLNQPKWLKSVNQGDPVKIRRKALKDWLYTINDVTYGGFTVHTIRTQMSKRDRKEHDNAWGLDFGDPNKIHVAPADWFQDDKDQKKGFFGLGKSNREPVTDKLLQSREHPMAANMASSLQRVLRKNPTEAYEIGEDGLNMLHHLSLTGSVVGVRTFLKCGADVNLKSTKGHTAIDFAKSLGWKRAYALLAKHGGKHAGK